MILASRNRSTVVDRASFECSAMLTALWPSHILVMMLCHSHALESRAGERITELLCLNLGVFLPSDNDRPAALARGRLPCRWPRPPAPAAVSSRGKESTSRAVKGASVSGGCWIWTGAAHPPPRRRGRITILHRVKGTPCNRAILRIDLACIGPRRTNGRHRQTARGRERKEGARRKAIFLSGNLQSRTVNLYPSPFPSFLSTGKECNQPWSSFGN